MSKFFILMVLMVDSQGHESLQRVNAVNYKDRLECMAAKAHHKDMPSMSFHCMTPTLLKQNKAL